MSRGLGDVYKRQIMAVLEKYAVPRSGFYSYQVKNGCGYITEFENGQLKIISELK